MKRDCVCPGPGWCARHRVHKNAKWVQLCQTHDGYWRAWEEGRGPGQLPHVGESKPAESQVADGPGTELHKLLARLGIHPTRGCQCKSREKIMNMWGPDKCEAKMEEIIGWMLEEARKRHLPAPRMLLRKLVRMAIARARAKVVEDRA